MEEVNSEMVISGGQDQPSGSLAYALWKSRAMSRYIPENV